MNAKNSEKGQGVQRANAVELIDCGRASEKTQGFYALVLFELGIPPFDTELII